MNSAKLIPLFDGSGDVEAWLCRAELIVQAKKEDPAEVIPVCLDGAAFAVYEQMVTADRNDFTRIREELTRAFGLTAYDAFVAFSNRRLQAGESVEVYATAITRLGRQCAISDDTALACKFLSGLPSEICEKVRLSLERVPKLGDAIKAAQVLLPNAHRASNGFVGRAIQSTSPTDIGDHPIRQCFKCGNIGHLAAKCRTRTCFSCGHIGHLARACPNRTRPSENYQGKIVSSLPQGNLPA